MVTIFRASGFIISTDTPYSGFSFATRFLRYLKTALSSSYSPSTSLHFAAALYRTSAGVLADALARFSAGLTKPPTCGELWAIGVVREMVPATREPWPELYFSRQRPIE